MSRPCIVTPALLLLLCVCSVGDSSGAAPSEPNPSPLLATSPVETQPVETQPEVTLVGVVGRAGIGCGSSWQAIKPTIGRVVILGPGAEGLEPDLVVMAKGRPTEPGPPPDLKDPVAECPVPQMRSDYEQTPLGMVIRRDPSPPMVAFHASRSEVAQVFSARATGDRSESVEVTVHNPLDQSWPQSEIRIHYEGCYGKPGHMQIERALQRLEPGMDQRFTFPLLQTQPVRGAMRPHRAASVQLVSPSADIVMDLDVDLASLGVAFECPDRRGRK